MDRILEQVQSGNFDPLKMFTGNKDQFLEVKTAIEKISNNLTKETCIDFLLAKIIPTAFDKTVSDATRDEAVEIGFHLLKFVNVSMLSPKEQENFLYCIEETYAKTVGELRDSNYANWDKLWILIIRFCHEKVHGKMSLANKLLRVVEMAFRNSTSIDQRLKAYDCWKELIDNSSLNMEHMCSAKQIKLLVTPLKAKFSRTPIVINKRCDIFMYLLEKLQDKAFLCLKEFLEFAFGPFEDKNDLEKMRQGKSVSEVCIKSTKVLIEILGHSHSNSEKCIQSDDILLHKSIISQQNFPDFAEILINSVVECCILLNEWSSDSSQSNTITKCLWRSLLLLIENSDETQRKCCTQLNTALRKLVERAGLNEPLHTLLGIVFGLLLKSQLTEYFKDVLFDIAMSLLCRKSADSRNFNEEEILGYIDSCFESANGPKFSKIASTYFKNDTKYANPNVLCELWLKCNFTVNSSNVASLIWPICYFKNFRDPKVVNLKWTTSYNECKSELVKIAVLQEIEKVFVENPLLSSNVVNFLQLISTLDLNPSKDFAARFMRLIELVLTLPNISETDLSKLSSIALNYCDQKKSFYKSEGIDEVLDKVCGCLEHLITIHKNYSILSDLYKHLKEGQPKILQKFSKRLLSILEALMLNEDDCVLSNTAKLMELLENKESEPDSIPLASTRSLRIINMTNAKPKNLKLFGKTAETSLGLKTTKSSPRKKNEVMLNDDKSSDYVKIDTEVKLDYSKLSEHQKEVLRKRREDIPALYQDLTQSQSKDFLVDSNEVGEGSKENLVVVDPKVILSPLPIGKEMEEDSAKKKRKRSGDNNDESSKKSKIEESTSSNAKDVGNVVMEPSKEKSKEKPAENSPRTESHAEKKNKRLRGRRSRQGNEVDNNEIKDVSLENGGIENGIDGQQTELKSKEQTKLKNEDNTDEKCNTEVEGVLNRTNENAQNEGKTLRKSARQMNRKYGVASPLLNLRRNRKNTGSSSIQNTESNSIQNTLDSDSTSTLEEKKQEDGVEKPSEETPQRKSRRQQNRPQREDFITSPEKEVSDISNVAPNAPEEDSIDVLLTKMDKKMEENRRLLFGKSEDKPRKPGRRSTSKNRSPEEKKTWQETLEDGNQNKIFLTKEEEEENLMQQEKIRQIVSKVKKQVMRTIPSEEISSKTSTDVYEFTGDDDCTVDELKKSIKKAKKKSLPVDLKGYIKRKRTKRSNREEGLPFHITADTPTPVPLSKSQSLRAVSSPQDGETLTILITRSPLEEVAKEKPEGEVEDGKTPPKKHVKRKSTSPEVHSEDVIESSQPAAIHMNVTTRRSPKLRPSPPNEETRRRTRSSPLPLPSVEKVEEKKPEEESIKSKQPRRLSLTETSSEIPRSARKKVRTRSLDKYEVDSEVSFLTKSMDVQSAETETIPSTEPKKLPDTLTQNSKEELPTSPVMFDTPDRVTELLNNTLDISPINSNHEEEEEAATTPRLHSNQTNVRVARLLQMVNSKVQFGNSKRVSSPSTSKVRKMRLPREEKLDVLTFSREVPSPLTVPPSGILKRKFSTLEESSTATPSPKRKRVNFSDPAITEKKIFIKETEEYDDIMDQNDDSTKELQNSDSDKESNVGNTFSDESNRGNMLDTIKDFCDSKLKNVSVDSSKSILKCLILNLNVPEIVEVVTEYLANLDKSTMKQVSNALVESEAAKGTIDHCVVPLLENENVFEIFLPRLIEVLERLPDSKLERFLRQIVKEFGENRMNNIVKEEMTHKHVEEHVVNNFDSDKMKKLIRTYFVRLEDQKRHEFLVDLMNLASGELPVNKEFVNCHVNVLQNFVKRLND